MVQHSRVPGVWIDIKVRGEGARYEGAEDFMPPSDSTHQSESIVDELPQVTRFIESKSGQGFTIKYATTSDFRFEEGCDMLFATVIIDGRCVMEQVIREVGSKTPEFGELKYIEYKDADGARWISRMTFSDIPTVESTDKRTAEADLERLKKMGTIRMVIHQVAQSAIRRAKKVLYQDDPQEPEFALKAVLEGNVKNSGSSHMTSFKAVGVAHFNEEEKWETSSDKEVVAFDFHYLPRECLQKRGIIPGSTHQQPRQAPPRKRRASNDADAANPRRKFRIPEGADVIDITGND